MVCIIMLYVCTYAYTYAFMCSLCTCLEVCSDIIVKMSWYHMCMLGTGACSSCKGTEQGMFILVIQKSC